MARARDPARGARGLKRAFLLRDALKSLHVGAGSRGPLAAPGAERRKRADSGRLPNDDGFRHVGHGRDRPRGPRIVSIALWLKARRRVPHGRSALLSAVAGHHAAQVHPAPPRALDLPHFALTMLQASVGRLDPVLASNRRRTYYDDTNKRRSSPCRSLLDALREFARLVSFGAFMTRIALVARRFGT